MADLHHAAQSGESFLVDFIASEQVGVVEKIAQEPTELPQGFRRAVHPSGDHAAGEFPWFQDGEAQNVKGLRWMKAVLGAVDADEEHAVGHSIGRGVGRLAQALDSAFHAAPSVFSPRGK